MCTEVRAYFDNIEEIIIGELKRAKKSIKLAVAWINVRTYHEIFMNLLKKGVKVEIILSDDMMNHRYKKSLEELTQDGAVVKFLRMPSKRNFMHHKFCIIDNLKVITGSYNWTSNAKKNFENIIVFKDELSVKKFKNEFKLLKELDHQSLLYLQGLEKCEVKKCNGVMCNLLVFEFIDDGFKSYANVDIVSICSEEHENHSHVIKSGIETGNLNLRLQSIIDYYNELEDANDSLFNIDDLYDYDIKQCLDDQLDDVKKYKGITIHGIGFVEEEPFGNKGDTTETTSVKWKNKFAASYIPDTYYFDLTRV